MVMLEHFSLYSADAENVNRTRTWSVYFLSFILYHLLATHIWFYMPFSQTPYIENIYTKNKRKEKRRKE